MNQQQAQFIGIKEASLEFEASRSTIERRREAARARGDSSVLRQFILRTNDGEEFSQPTREQVADLNKKGMRPEWLVSRTWLAKEFQRKEEKPVENNDSTNRESTASPPVLDELKRQYEARIDDLKEQLKAARDDSRREREDKLKLLDYAQSDKQLFANAQKELTQVLALPGIAAARKAEQPTITVNDDGDRPQKKKSTASKNAKPKQRKRGLLSALIPRRT